MITIKCGICGEDTLIDETLATEPICKVCGKLITKENSKDFAEIIRQREEAYAEALEQSNGLREKCARAAEGYKNSSGDDAVKCVTPLLGAYSDYKALPDFFKIWRDFILAVSAEAVSKKDAELLSFLKNHAKRFDEEMKGGDSLYLFLLMSNTKIGNNTDWDILIEQTCGDGVKFSSLVHSIKDYIVANRNKAFAIYVFNLLASKDEEWKREVKTYLSTILDDDAVAENVFPRRAFGGKTKKFIRKANTYCKKYCSEYVVEETKVWANYVAACKMQKRRNLCIAIGALAVVAGAAIGVTCYLNAIDKETVAFNVETVISHTYGEALDLSDYTVTYKKNSGAEVTKPVTIKMLSGYNAEVVGTQQTVFVEYAGVRKGITVIINPAMLATPVLSLSGNYLTWEYVANASNYDVYVNSETVSTATVDGLSYDLSSNDIYGNLEINVRANADATGKYANSEKSQKVEVTKLQAPQNVRYADGFIRWDEVSGATKYELTVNGNSYSTTNNFYEIGFAQGDNAVKVIASTASASLISGITEKTIYYYKHQPATNVSYTANRVYWEAEDAATAFEIWVDGALWKEFTRKYFDVETDGFATDFNNGVHTIEIVSKSSRTGTEPSQKAEFNVAVGNHITFTDNATLRWDAVETGSSGAVTYSVLINGSLPLTLSEPYFTLSQANNWTDGGNTVMVTAKYGSTTVICETIKVTKLTKPQISVAGGIWKTDGNVNNRYSVNGGEWLTELPKLNTLTAGNYTVAAKRVRSSDSAFEIESDTVEVKISKPATPSISVSRGEIVCNYDKSKYDLKLYRSDLPSLNYSEISSLSDIHMEGKHYIRAALVGKEGANTEYDWIVPSARSEYVEVNKLKTPAVFYNKGDLAVTSDMISSRLKFYYLLDGVETELVGGLIKNLPKGVFSIYARLEATANNELTSENTPASARASVFNMDITLSVSKISSGTGRRFNVIFDGCEGINEINFTYEVVHYNAGGNRLGSIKVDESTKFSKEDSESTSIFGRLDLFTDATFETRETRKIELIVYISSGTETQQLTASVDI